MVGANLTKGHWETSIYIYLITFLIAFLLFIFLKKKDKNNEIIEIMK